MVATHPATDTRNQTERAASGVLRFVLWSYAIAWAWCAPLVMSGATVEQGVGWPTHVPALLAPLGAALLATVAIDGRRGLTDLVQRMGRWRFPLVWWSVVVSPVAVLALTLGGLRLAGRELPEWGDFAQFGGLPSYGVLSTFLLVLVLNGFGEETGWRGLLQDRLQQRLDPVRATLVVAVIWAVWHMPFFFILSTYAGFDATTLVMFPLGLASGAIVLTWLYNHTGRSILAVALWHTLYNMAVATAGATDLIQGVVTAAVMCAAAVLVTAEVVARRRGRRSILGAHSAR